MYVKLFSDLLCSSLWAESSETRVVWVTMLLMATRDGLVRSTAPGISHAARVGIGATEEALKKFEGPDANSRSQEHEGRRVERVEGGYLILNYGHYRGVRDEEDRREKDRERQRRRRGGGSGGSAVFGGEGAGGVATSRSVTACHALSRSVTACHGVSGECVGEGRNEGEICNRNVADGVGASDKIPNNQKKAPVLGLKKGVPLRRHGLSRCVTPCHAPSRHTDTDAEADTDKRINDDGTEPKQVSASVPPTVPYEKKQGRSGGREVPEALLDLPLYVADEKLCRAWPGLYEAMKTACPGVDVLAETRRAHAYEVANPKKRKKVRSRFLMAWMFREQDRPRRVGPESGGTGGGAPYE